MYLAQFLILCFFFDPVFTAYKDVCISSKNHKNVPGPEGKALASYHCTPWEHHSCCTWNTTKNIDKDNILSLYGIPLDQCPSQKLEMSDACKKYFYQDTCLYECSPNLGPWITDDPTKKTRKERYVGIPLCAQDCRDWYHSCMYDYTCNDNWSKNWNWTNKGTPDMCTKPCKQFKDYFPDPKTFCENLFDHSFKYTLDESKCMNLQPKGDKNKRVSDQQAEILEKENGDQRLYISNGVIISLCILIFMIY